jgi:hypothetical protein
MTTVSLSLGVFYLAALPAAEWDPDKAEGPAPALAPGLDRAAAWVVDPVPVGAADHEGRRWRKPTFQTPHRAGIPALARSRDRENGSLNAMVPARNPVQFCCARIRPES